MGTIVKMIAKNSCVLFLLLGSSFALPLDRAAEDNQQYRGVFDKLDQDGDGIVTQAEVLAVLQALGFNVTAEEVSKFMDNIDNVDYDPLVDNSQRTEDTDEEIKNAFKMFDMDGSSTIDLAEMTALLSLYDITNADAYLQAFDLDGSGELDLEEYKAGFYA